MLIIIKILTHPFTAYRLLFYEAANILAALVTVK